MIVTRCLRSKRALAWLLTLLLSPTGNPALGAQVSRPKSLWQVQLKQYGVRGPRIGLINDPGTNVVIASTKQVVVAAFQSKAEVRRDSPSGSWKLIGLFFNASTGELMTQNAWDVGEFSSYEIFATKAGNFLLYLVHPFTRGLLHPANVLVLLSPEGQILKRVALPLSEDAQSATDWWDLRISPNGDKVLLTHQKDDLLQYQILDTDALEDRMTWHENAPSRYWIFSISSNYVMREDTGSQEIYLGSSDKLGQNLPRLPKSTRAALLSDKQIVEFDQEPPTVEVMNANGQIALSYNLKIGREGTIYAPIVSADGLHFAGMIDVRPQAILSPRRSYVFVGQVQAHDPVLALEIPWPSPGANSVFLSPDGDRLGIASSDKLSVFSIPREPTGNN